MDRTRFDAESVIATAIENNLRETHEVLTGLGTDADPSVDQPFTVVVATTTPTGFGRWLFSSSVTLTTFGPDSDSTWNVHNDAADSLLTCAFDSEYRFSGQTCTQEPREINTQPGDWTTVTSTYDINTREETLNV